MLVQVGEHGPISRTDRTVGATRLPGGGPEPLLELPAHALELSSRGLGVGLGEIARTNAATLH